MKLLIHRRGLESGSYRFSFFLVHAPCLNNARGHHSDNPTVDFSITYSIHSGFLILKLMRLDKRCVCARVFRIFIRILCSTYLFFLFDVSSKYNERVFKKLLSVCKISTICTE